MYEMIEVYVNNHIEYIFIEIENPHFDFVNISWRIDVAIAFDGFHIIQILFVQRILSKI